MHRRPTVTGFFVFAGLIAGAVIGKWLPYLASLEAIAGGIIGAVLGFMIDRVNAKKYAALDQNSEDT